MLLIWAVKQLYVVSVTLFNIHSGSIERADWVIRREKGRFKGVGYLISTFTLETIFMNLILLFVYIF